MTRHFRKTAALSEDQAQEMILGVSNYQSLVKPSKCLDAVFFLVFQLLCFTPLHLFFSPFSYFDFLLIFITKLVPWNRKLGNDSQFPWLVPLFHAYGTFLRAYLEQDNNLHLSILLNLFLRSPNWRQNLVLE